MPIYDLHSRPDAAQWNFLVDCLTGSVRYQISHFGAGGRVIASSLSCSCGMLGNLKEDVVYLDNNGVWQFTPGYLEYENWYENWGADSVTAARLRVASLPSPPVPKYLEGFGCVNSGLTADQLYIPGWDDNYGTNPNPYKMHQELSFDSNITDGYNSGSTGGTWVFNDIGGSGIQPSMASSVLLNPPGNIPFPGLLASLPDGCTVSCVFPLIGTETVTTYTQQGTLSMDDTVCSYEYGEYSETRKVEMCYIACMADEIVFDAYSDAYHKCSFQKIDDPCKFMYENRNNSKFIGCGFIRADSLPFFQAPSVETLKLLAMTWLPAATFGRYYPYGDDKVRGYVVSAVRSVLNEAASVDLSKIQIEVEYPTSENNRIIINPAEWGRME